MMGYIVLGTICAALLGCLYAQLNYNYDLRLERDAMRIRAEYAEERLQRRKLFREMEVKK